MKKIDKIVIAIDSFKGSISSVQAGNIVAKTIKSLLPEAETLVFPVADGGEGTVDALVEGLGGTIINTKVTGPLGTQVTSRYGIVKDRKLAVIEMADAAGITMVPKEQRNPLNTTTYGLGELLLKATQDGCRDFIIGVGGSATNDCGLGMLSALGVRFYKKDGTIAGRFGRDLKDVSSIDVSGINPILRKCRFRIACDVTNPLTGSNGCSFVYGPQKGATPEIITAMDAAITAFAKLVESNLGMTGANFSGAGAAGGLGYAFHAFLGGELVPGIKLILDVSDIKSTLKDADVLITGEGRMDSQTAMGKAPVGIAKFAKEISPDIRTIGICGCALADAIYVNDAGIDAYFPILHMPSTVEEAMDKDTTCRNLEQTVTQIFRLLKSE